MVAELGQGVILFALSQVFSVMLDAEMQPEHRSVDQRGLEVVDKAGHLESEDLP